MVETLVLKAEKRLQCGSRYSQKLRQQGYIPAIIYGHKQDPVSVQLNAHDLNLELQHHHRLLELELDDKREKCLVKDVQFDYLGEKVIHVDLARVALDERVTVTVELELRGTPLGVTEGGTLNQLLNEIEVECVVTNIPETLRMKINEMKIGDTLTAGDVELPSGTVLKTAPETPVALVQMAVEVVEEEEAPVEEGAAEPEVITDREREEGGGEESS